MGQCCGTHGTDNLNVNTELEFEKITSDELIKTGQSGDILLFHTINTMAFI